MRPSSLCSRLFPLHSFARLRYAHSNAAPDILPSSQAVLVRKRAHKVSKQNSELQPNGTEESEDVSERRLNDLNIQMLSKNIFEQLFGKETSKQDPSLIAKCQSHLQQHGIDYSRCAHRRDVKLTLPALRGASITEHFHNIGEEQSAPYRSLLKRLVEEGIPDMPTEWVMEPGWHRYSSGKPPERVAYPPDEALVFDVEVLMRAGSQPTLACAASTHYWYGWVSDALIHDTRQHSSNIMEYDELIPLETDSAGRCANSESARIVVGHNVSFDRAKVKEQYWLEQTGLRFMDTMSMHTCVSGVTSYQRAVLKSKDREENATDDAWIDISSLNGLADVHKLYCGTSVEKEPRDIFFSGTMSDVRDNFQYLMSYCGNDVAATHRVLVQLLPMFMERFPHPVTLAGMLELGSAYLPVNTSWLQYIESADTAFEDLKLESRHLLSLKADEACRLMNNDDYKRDLWMWDQDWSTQTLKLKKATKKKMSELMNQSQETTEIEQTKDNIDYMEINGARLAVLNNKYINNLVKNSLKPNCSQRKEELSKKFSRLYKMKDLLPVKRPQLAGYPAWYRKLCTKPDKEDDWIPGAQNITTSMQITPKLLRLSWEGYPLHYLRSEGWGFLVPFAQRRAASYSPEDEPQVPLEQLTQECPVVDFERSANEDQSSVMLQQLGKSVDEDFGRRAYYARKRLDETAREHRYTGLGVWSGVCVQGCCHFLRLPHKDGPKYKVGNPLAKDFLDKFSQNVLSAQGNAAENVLNLGRMMSYWRNNRERILGQRVVWLPPERLPENLRAVVKRYGAILPQVVVCGTLTRRGVEPTWMTASNAHTERIGSELRAMVQAPPGYKFVGADVDSQELWIASLLGDSELGIAGGTALGWSVLAGDKAQGTDLHSLTARAAGISRDHAKVINYARIYGAGQNFAERLLKQFNPTMTNSEAKSKAARMFTTTKGRRVYRLKPEFFHNFIDDGEEMVCEMPSYQAMRIAKMSGRKLEEMFERPKWFGGTESNMFNKLEEIADSEAPATAFLSGRLSRALEHSEGRWASTRLNWAVQSAAADFLHLMLVCMRWLAPRSARFSLSFHDEVRYLVREEDKYETALALQLTNLLTRAFCSQRVGLNDLPLSVAFFTAVEVDQVLRKESNLDCRTPSNPHGLEKGYGIPNGESLNIFDILEKTHST